MSVRYPFEALTFELKVDSRPVWVPLDEPVACMECQSSEFATPFKAEGATASEIDNDVWKVVIAERV
jgi:hypothetical protein